MTDPAPNPREELAIELLALLEAYRKPDSTTADAFALRSHLVAHADEIIEVLLAGADYPALKRQWFELWQDKVSLRRELAAVKAERDGLRAKEGRRLARVRTEHAP